MQPSIHPSMHTYTHAYIQAISTAPRQVQYYSEALLTQHRYCVGVSLRSAKATANEGLAQGRQVAVRAGFEPTPHNQYNHIHACKHSTRLHACIHTCIRTCVH